MLSFPVSRCITQEYWWSVGGACLLNLQSNMIFLIVLSNPLKLPIVKSIRNYFSMYMLTNSRLLLLDGITARNLGASYIKFRKPLNFSLGVCGKELNMNF